MGLLTPDRCVASVDRIDVVHLVEVGIRCVLVDRDNTCVPRGGSAPDAVCTWFSALHNAGIEVIMVSNNFHGAQVEASAAELGIACVHHALKPLPRALRRAMRRAGVAPSQTAMVGDQLFTDVLAGNLAGVTTILVRPQSKRDLWFTRVLHLFEQPFLHGRVFEGEERPSSH